MKDLELRVGWDEVIIQEGDQVGEWGYLGNWGDCAKACRDKNTDLNRGLCKYWSWAGSDCKDCIPGACSLHADSQVPPGRVRRHGFISGSVSCQDIDYMADDDEKIVDSQHLTKIKENGPDFSPCPVVEEGSVEHDCPAQVVPGFRFEFNIMHYSILLFYSILFNSINPTPRNALSVGSSVRHVFYPHLTRTHTNLICERAR